ncbi:conserved hypothetical protein [Verticillium alfalfae VaMs.102]|uniref:RING-type E3 ubiquitin transferase n=1 Tax=Verticillium alfalfae (strain VaMs.102 / ATCC MYA-4576 / FGSC 10136) TaxID=526221 RepID=C9ST63_VERA1|nr:conserved hypothetical protein [Verticillium alfalfae VaMs.102]EEY21978.1 conserved hypothetical protein [Verticillium alfalfae VaMs.102]
MATQYEDSHEPLLVLDAAQQPPRDPDPRRRRLPLHPPAAAVPDPACDRPLDRQRLPSSSPSSKPSPPTLTSPPVEIPGVGQSYLDALDRVDRKTLGQEEQCPICAERFLDDQYCLVVELPCHHSHRFDLECVGPWLMGKGSCPMCRKDLTKKKEVPIVQDDEEDDDPDGLYA